MMVSSSKIISFGGGNFGLGGGSGLDSAMRGCVNKLSYVPLQ